VRDIISHILNTTHMLNTKIKERFSAYPKTGYFREYSKEYSLEYTFFNIFKNEINIGQMSKGCSLIDFLNYDNSFIRYLYFEPFMVLKLGRINLFSRSGLTLFQTL